jgi:hypothetical protein
MACEPGTRPRRRWTPLHFMSVRHKVLVVDTGDPLLTAVENAARDLGHLIYNHASPVGVGQALAQHDADVVMFFWDQPREQDHKLKTLIESWERFRTLKTVVFSRSRANELPGVLAGAGDRTVLRPDDLQDLLATVLGQPSREFEAVDPGPGEGSHFITRLRRRLTEASVCWEGIAQGSPSHREMDFLLGTAQGQAQLIHLDKLVALITEVRTVVRDSSGTPRPEQYESVTAALRFSVHATLAPPYDADRDVQPMLTRLRKSRRAG